MLDLQKWYFLFIPLWVRFTCVIFDVRVYTLIFASFEYFFCQKYIFRNKILITRFSTWAKWYFWCLDKILFSLPMNNNILFFLLPLGTLLIKFHCFNYPSFRIPVRSPDILGEGTVLGTSLEETGLGPPKLQGSPPQTSLRRGGSNSRQE